MSSYKITIILVRFHHSLPFFDRFSINTQDTKFHVNPSSGR